MRRASDARHVAADNARHAAVLISGLYFYPVKGAAGIPLTSATLDDFGVAHDRRWMVVDGERCFITPRKTPRLALLRTAITGDSLVLEAPQAGTVTIPLRPDHPPGVVAVRVWDDDVAAHDCGDAAAGLLSDWLGRTARLVHMPDSTVRPLDPRYSQPGDRVGFADGYPLLIIGQASLDELNRRLDGPVPMLRFRPNIVVAGAEPHAEDEWGRIRLGSIDCDVVKPCGRCVVTTLDLDTAVASREPLRTLATYRHWDGHVWFGMNAIHRGAGVLSIGDPVVAQGRVVKTAGRSITNRTMT